MTEQRKQPDKTNEQQRAGERGVGGMPGEDARGNPHKQRENEERMGVRPDHKTEDMEKKQRGTFP